MAPSDAGALPAAGEAMTVPNQHKDRSVEKGHGLPPLDEFKAFAEKLDPDIGPMFGRDAARLVDAYDSLFEQLESLGEAIRLADKFVQQPIDLNYVAIPKDDWEIILARVSIPASLRDGGGSTPCDPVAQESSPATGRTFSVEITGDGSGVALPELEDSVGVEPIPRIAGPVLPGAGPQDSSPAKERS